jgi:hypothetical protein
MKTKYSILVMTYFFFPCLLLAQVNNDSVPETKGQDTTTVRFGKTTIIIVGDKEERNTTISNLPDTSKSKKKRPESHWAGIELGINMFMNKDNEFDVPSGYDFLELNEAKSIALNINFTDKELSLINNRLLLVSGLGMTFNNYRFRNNITLLADTNRVAGTYDTINYQKSKLSVTYLTVPLLLEYTDGKSKRSFHIAAGIIGGLRIGSHTKQKYSIGNKTVKPKVRDDFNLSPIRYDATIRFGFGSLAFFSTYTLNGLFKEKRGPEIHPFTAGIGLIF